MLRHKIGIIGGLGACFATEVDHFKIACFDILPVDVREVQISMQGFGILASLDFSLLFESTFLEYLESLLREVGEGHYLDLAQPFLPLGAALARKQR